MKKIRIKMMTAMLSAVVLTAGCAGTGTTGGTAIGESQELPTETETETSQPQGGKADWKSIEGFLKMLTAHTRASGTEGEGKAAEEIKDELEQMGYETELESFEQPGIGDAPPISGTNVIAFKKPEQSTNRSDILYITAHHDAKPGIQGAEDDASGVSVLLEIARLVSSLPTDTEIRFVTFAGEEEGRVGSRFHVEGLTEEERSRVIGDIQLDDLGYWGSEYLQLGTVDGESVMLGEMLSGKAQSTPNLGRAIPFYKEEMSDHNPFHTHAIPAVALGQDTFAFENHSTQDRAEILDFKRLQQTAQLVADVTADIMSADTGSLQETAYEGRNVQTAYEIQPDTVIQFDMDRNYVENMMGLSGNLVEESVNEYGDALQICQYPVIWFGMEEPLNTLFQYRNGYLETVEIPKQDALGETAQQVKSLMEAALGTSEAAGSDNGTAYSWEDKVYHKYYSLEPAQDAPYHILVLNYNLGKESRAVYDLSGGIGPAKETAAEESGRKLLDMLEAVIYPEDLPLIQFNVYSDGKAASTGYTGAFTEDDNTQMEYALDYVDAFDESGEYREYNKTVRTAVHEYGHVISLNKRQVDMTRQDETMPPIMFEQETYGKDAYMRAYYEKFWTGLDVKSGLEHYADHPDEFVSAYAATDLSEDFAESFMLFVLSSKPEDDSAASEKIRFFYGYEELVARRDYIRSNLGLEETTGSRAPELADGDYRVALDGNPTTGYHWSYTVEPEGIVSEVASGYYQNYHDRDLVGAGGTYVFDFTGEKQGVAEVTFVYERSWEKGKSEEEKTYHLTVDADGRVTGEETKK